MEGGDVEGEDLKYMSSYSENLALMLSNVLHVSAANTKTVAGKKEKKVEVSHLFWALHKDSGFLFLVFLEWSTNKTISCSNKVSMEKKPSVAHCDSFSRSSCFAVSSGVDSVAAVATPARWTFIERALYYWKNPSPAAFFRVISRCAIVRTGWHLRLTPNPQPSAWCVCSGFICVYGESNYLF